MNEEAESLIEEARNAGRVYIDSFNGDVAAVLADLRRRGAAAGRETTNRSPKPPHSWQNKPTAKLPAA